ncbi:hypothetical protein V1284_006120 [Nitrobacteraceae bacterium AZCC 2299]
MSAGDGLAEPHAGVESGRDHIDQRVIDHDLDADIRKRLQKSRHHRQQHQLRRLPGGVEAQRAGRLAAKMIEVLQRVIDVLERRADAREQKLTGLGQRHAAGGAVDEAQVKPLLDAAQGMAQRRRRYAEFDRRVAKAAVPGDRQKRREVGGTDAAH